MAQRSHEQDYYRRRASAEIALARATGAAKAYAEVDNKTVVIERPDGTLEKVRIPKPDARTN